MVLNYILVGCPWNGNHTQYPGSIKVNNDDLTISKHGDIWVRQMHELWSCFLSGFYRWTDDSATPFSAVQIELKLKKIQINTRWHFCREKFTRAFESICIFVVLPLTMHEKLSGIKYVWRILPASQWFNTCNALSTSINISTRDFVW